MRDYTGTHRPDVQYVVENISQQREQNANVVMEKREQSKHTRTHTHIYIYIYIIYIHTHRRENSNLCLIKILNAYFVKVLSADPSAKNSGVKLNPGMSAGAAARGVKPE